MRTLKISLLVFILPITISAHWELLKTNSQEWFTSLYFVNDSTGWVCGNNGTILKTTNYGTTWVRQHTNTLRLLRSIYFINNNVGIATGNQGIILTTTNGGDNWNVISDTMWFYAFNSVHFHENYGWAVGGDFNYASKIFHSTNNGVNWSEQFLQLNNDILSVFAVDKDTVYCTDFVGNIFKTTNGGQFWSLIESVNYTLNAVKFYNAAIGFIVGDGSYLEDAIILKTTNNGSTWETKPSNSGVEVYLHDLSIIENKVFAVGGHYAGFYGVVVWSEDYGENWRRDSLATRLWGVQFASPEIGYAVGENGCVYRYGDINYLDDDFENELSTVNYSLSQNYPNPFNPITKIKYEIPGQARNDNALVTLKFYDILGREITTLVNEEKSAGEYEVEFHAANLPSGIYFYQLNTGSYSKTKKIVLLR